MAERHQMSCSDSTFHLTSEKGYRLQGFKNCPKRKTTNNPNLDKDSIIIRNFLFDKCIVIFLVDSLRSVKI